MTASQKGKIVLREVDAASRKILVGILFVPGVYISDV